MRGLVLFLHRFLVMMPTSGVILGSELAKSQEYFVLSDTQPAEDIDERL